MKLQLLSVVALFISAVSFGTGMALSSRLTKLEKTSLPAMLNSRIDQLERQHVFDRGQIDHLNGAVFGKHDAGIVGAPVAAAIKPISMTQAEFLAKYEAANKAGRNEFAKFQNELGKCTVCDWPCRFDQVGGQTMDKKQSSIYVMMGDIQCSCWFTGSPKRFYGYRQSQAMVIKSAVLEGVTGMGLRFSDCQFDH